MKRVVLFLATLLLALVGATPTAAATLAPDSATPSPSYASRASSTTDIYTAAERGPASYSRAATYDAVDLRSNGASARSEGPTPPATTTYVDPTELEQVAQATSATSEQVRRAVGELLSARAAQAAANGGDDLTRVGRWMSPDEHANMVRTGEVQVGGGGTTYVSHPPSIEVWRKQTDPGNLFVEFDVPRGVLRPGGQPGHAQIPSPSHPAYGRLAEKKGVPLQYPVPACNIVVVGSC